jgi:D-arginine dehydrogenase
MSDYLIIGGGIAGISLAARLAPHGSVTLLEAEAQFAHHASGRSAALYEPYYGLRPVVELSLASGDFFHQMENLLTPRGMMILGKAGEESQLANEAALFNLDRMTPAEAAAILPNINQNVVTAAAFAMNAWDIDTDLLIQNFLRMARAQGAIAVNRARVKGIARGSEGWQVQTTAGDFTAHILINAAGAWVDEVAVMAGVRPLGFAPLRRSMARIPAPEGMDVSGWPMTFGVGEAWYMKPDAGALIVSPAEEDPSHPHDAWADDMVLAEGLARYEEVMTEGVTRLISNWAGLRTFAPDRVMVIGQDPAVPDFFWQAGQGGYGFQSSPAASQLGAELILGRAPEMAADVVQALSPARFG